MFPVHKLSNHPCNLKKLRPVLGLIACLCVASHAALADIYMFTNESGTPNFSNIPVDTRYELTLRTEQDEGLALDSEHKKKFMNPSNRQVLRSEIMLVATEYHLDPGLLQAVIAAESGYDANAVSIKGALGLMQLMPETARCYGADDPFDPGQNIRAGARYLSSLLQRFGNSLPLALAAYNSGESNVIKYGERIPPFRETVSYVPKVMRLYRRYRMEYR